MPELGRFDRRQAASLVGIAPFDCGSGERTRGRTQARRLLYIAAINATPY